MRLQKDYGTYIEANPCSEIVGGWISQAVVSQAQNRDFGNCCSNEEQFDDKNVTLNFFMQNVCAETNNQR